MFDDERINEEEEEEECCFSMSETESTSNSNDSQSEDDDDDDLSLTFDEDVDADDFENFNIFLKHLKLRYKYGFVGEEDEQDVDEEDPKTDFDIIKIVYKNKEHELQLHINKCIGHLSIDLNSVSGDNKLVFNTTLICYEQSFEEEDYKNMFELFKKDLHILGAKAYDMKKDLIEFYNVILE